MWFLLKQLYSLYLVSIICADSQPESFERFVTLNLRMILMIHFRRFSLACNLFLYFSPLIHELHLHCQYERWHCVFPTMRSFTNAMLSCFPGTIWNVRGFLSCLAIVLPGPVLNVSLQKAMKQFKLILPVSITKPCTLGHYAINLPSPAHVVYSC